MSDTTGPRAIKRILVALDASPHSLAALEASAELAARHGAELVGLFVEDLVLMRSAELPFTREICAFASHPRTIDARSVERQLRSQANRARQSMESIARRARIKWSFVVARGSVPAEVTDAARKVDLIILGSSGWSPLRRRLGSTAAMVLRQVPAPTLLIRQGFQLEPPLIVVYDGSDVSRRALYNAIGLAGAPAAELKVLILAENEAGAAELRQEVEGTLHGAGQTAQLEILLRPTTTVLERALAAEKRGTVVLPNRSAYVEQDDLVEVVSAIERPVLWVR